MGDPGFAIRGAGYGVRGAGYGVRDTGCGIRGAGYGVRGTGCGVRGAGYGVRDAAGCGIRGAGYGVRSAGYGIRGAGCSATTIDRTATRARRHAIAAGLASGVVWCTGSSARGRVHGVECTGSSARGRESFFLPADGESNSAGRFVRPEKRLPTPPL